MSLRDKLLQDIKEALKQKDNLRKTVIQIIRAELLQLEKDSKIEITDDVIINVIVKEIKKRKDVLPDYEKSGRIDSINDINKEINILMSYLPKQLSEDEVLKIIRQTLLEDNISSIKDIGRAITAITPKVKGSVDMKCVVELIKKELK